MQQRNGETRSACTVVRTNKLLCQQFIHLIRDTCPALVMINNNDIIDMSTIILNSLIWQHCERSWEEAGGWDHFLP